LTDTPEKLEAAAVGQADIQQNQRRGVGTQRIEAGTATREMLRCKALGLKRKLHRLGYGEFVFDDEYAGALQGVAMPYE